MTSALAPGEAEPCAPCAAGLLSLVSAGSSAEAPARARLYASEKILQDMPYFQARLSERWEKAGRTEPLYLRLPDGCTIGALSLLLERLHFTSGRWGAVDFGMALQIAQLAGMFLAEHDGLLPELSRLLRNSVRGQADIDTVTALVHRIDAPTLITSLAASFARPRLSTLVGDAQLTEMLQNVLASGDASTAEAVEKILVQRAKRDADSIKRNASVLQAVLQVGPATAAPAVGVVERLTVVHSESAGRWSEWVERPAPGLQHVLQITTKMVLCHPEYLSTLAPLMLPQFPVNAHWTRSALVTDLLKRTVRTLFDGCFVQNGLSSEVAQEMGAGISNLMSSIIANGHEDLLHANASLGSAVARAASISSASVALMCTALLRLKSTTLSSFVTAALLAAMCGSTRQQVCLAIMPNMHTLGPEVKAAVLAEIDADDSGSESSDDSSRDSQGAPKRQRV